jgi:hypothetical protein
VPSAELSRRDGQRGNTSLRLSSLPLGQTPSNLDWGFQPGFDRRRVETLATR